MKKISSKLFVMTFATAALMGLSACAEYFSPRAVVRTAYTAVKTQDLKMLRSSLTGAALEKYGSSEGMAGLAKTLEGQEVSTGYEFLLSRETVKDTQTGLDVVRFYEVPVMTKVVSGGTYTLKELMTAKVRCSVVTKNMKCPRNNSTVNCGRDGYQDGVGQGEETMSCQIMALEIL